MGLLPNYLLIMASLNVDDFHEEAAQANFHEEVAQANFHEEVAQSNLSREKE